jgi:hypothetical protein
MALGPWTGRLAALGLICLAALVPARPASAGSSPDLDILKACYPGAWQGVEKDASGAAYLVMADGARLIYDDGQDKTPEEALEHPDLKDMLAQLYPLGPVTQEPAPGLHPGRCRVQAFFQAVYGHDEVEVRNNLVPVRFLNTTVLFNRQNGAAKALQDVAAELSGLLAAHPEYKRFILPVDGTFFWRTIARTGRLSLHSFGVAIDLNAKRNTYWQWHKGSALALRLRFPVEVMEIFEGHGFIWGGKWAEFDLMHFEYRPELIAKAKQPR